MKDEKKKARQNEMLLNTAQDNILLLRQYAITPSTHCFHYQHWPQ